MPMSSVHLSHFIAPVLFASIAVGCSGARAQAPYNGANPIIQVGTIAVGVGDGQYDFVQRNGSTLLSLSEDGLPITAVEPTGKGFTTGCAFSKDLTKLYTTNYGHHSVSVFGINTPGVELLDTIDTSSGGLQNESIVFDQSGNWYVGHAAGSCEVSKYSPDNVLLDTFHPASSCIVNSAGNGTGVNWIELASDQKTLYYTSGEFAVKRYDLSTRTQLPDLTTTLKGHAQQIRLLPPFDVNSDLLVADENAIVRIDKSGQIVQTYGTRKQYENVRNWIGLALDPDNTSFWAGDTNSDFIEEFNLATGAAESFEPQKIPNLKITGDRVAGLCIQGSPTAPAPTPWQTGDIFVGAAYSYARYSSTGTYKDSVAIGPHGSWSGGFPCAFNKDGSELVGLIGGFESISTTLDGTGTTHALLGETDDSDFGNGPDAVVFNSSGGHIVADNTTNSNDSGGFGGIGIFGPPAGPNDNPSSFAIDYPPVDYTTTNGEGDVGGIFGMDLAADQKTLFYTAFGPHIMTYNISTGNTTNFAQIAGQNLGPVHLLPPFDGTGGLLVETYQRVYRLDGTGKVIHTYKIPSLSTVEGDLFALHLDPNGKSFWVGGTLDLTELMYRINIDSGAVEIGPIDTTRFGVGPSCIKGEPGGYMAP